MHFQNLHTLKTMHNIVLADCLNVVSILVRFFFDFRSYHYKPNTFPFTSVGYHNNATWNIKFKSPKIFDWTDSYKTPHSIIDCCNTQHNPFSRIHDSPSTCHRNSTTEVGCKSHDKCNAYKFYCRQRNQFPVHCFSYNIAHYELFNNLSTFNYFNLTFTNYYSDPVYFSFTYYELFNN